MSIQTNQFSVKPMQFINVVLQIQLARYKYVIVAIMLLLVILPIIKLHYIYASIIIFFGVVPFAIFHLYFSALSQIKINQFVEKTLIIENDKLKLALLTGEQVEFSISQIKYIGYHSSCYVITTPDKGLLLIPYQAFTTKEDSIKFLKIITSQK